MGKRIAILLKLFIGSAVGFVNGFLGGGGGMLSVPLLEKGLKEDVKVSHATTIMIILPASVASGLVYFFGGKFDGNVSLPVIIGVVVGGILGAFMLKRLQSGIITIIFIAIMIFAGIRMVLA